MEYTSVVCILCAKKLFFVCFRACCRLCSGLEGFGIQMRIGCVMVFLLLVMFCSGSKLEVMCELILFAPIWVKYSGFLYLECL